MKSIRPLYATLYGGVHIECPECGHLQTWRIRRKRFRFTCRNKWCKRQFWLGVIVQPAPYGHDAEVTPPRDIFVIQRAVKGGDVNLYKEESS